MNGIELDFSKYKGWALRNDRFGLIDDRFGKIQQNNKAEPLDARILPLDMMKSPEE